MPKKPTKPKPPRWMTKLIAEFIETGGTILNDAEQLVFKPAETGGASGLIAQLELCRQELTDYLIPSVDPADDQRVQDYFADFNIEIAFHEDKVSAFKAVTAILEEAGADQPIGLDFETEVLPAHKKPIPITFTKSGTKHAHQPKTGDAGAALDPYRSRVLLAQVYAGGRVVHVFDMRAVPWATLEPLFDNDRPVVAHNAVFECKRLIHEAGIARPNLHDTMTAGWLTHGVKPSLEAAADLYHGLDVPKGLGASDWSATITPEKLRYAGLDAVLTYMIYQEQRAAFDEIDEQVQYYFDRMVPSVARMELAGMPFDVAAHRQHIEEWKTELEEAHRALEAVSGGRDLRTRDGLQDHLAEHLDDYRLANWPLTKTELLSTDKKVLGWNTDLPAVSELLEVRRLEKLLSAFGPGLIDALNQVTGRLHPSFNIAGASSGRFSASQPNLQQMPRNRLAGFRTVFKAPSGRVLINADYSQIELRVAAELVSDVIDGDSALRAGFASGLDAHTTTALGMTRKNDPSSITPLERNRAKAPNFGLLYGMKNRGFFNYVRSTFNKDATQEETDEMIELFFAGYPDLGEWQRNTVITARADGYITTVLGRRWYWHWRAKPEEEIDYNASFVESQRTGFRPTYALNHPVQGSAAECMVLALADIDAELIDQNIDASIIATVHDEVVIEAADDPQVVRTVAGIVERMMTKAFSLLFPDAPTLNLVEATAGPTWKDQVPIETYLSQQAV